MKHLTPLLLAGSAVAFTPLSQVRALHNVPSGHPTGLDAASAYLNLPQSHEAVTVLAAMGADCDRTGDQKACFEASEKTVNPSKKVGKCEDSEDDYRNDADGAFIAASLTDDLLGECGETYCSNDVKKCRDTGQVKLCGHMIGEFTSEGKKQMGETIKAALRKGAKLSCQRGQVAGLDFWVSITPNILNVNIFGGDNSGQFMQLNMEKMDDSNSCSPFLQALGSIAGMVPEFGSFVGGTIGAVCSALS